MRVTPHARRKASRSTRWTTHVLVLPDERLASAAARRDAPRAISALRAAAIARTTDATSRRSARIR